MPNIDSVAHRDYREARRRSAFMAAQASGLRLQEEASKRAQSRFVINVRKETVILWILLVFLSFFIVWNVVKLMWVSPVVTSAFVLIYFAASWVIISEAFGEAGSRRSIVSAMTSQVNFDLGFWTFFLASQVWALLLAPDSFLADPWYLWYFPQKLRLCLAVASTVGIFRMGTKMQRHTLLAQPEVYVRRISSHLLSAAAPKRVRDAKEAVKKIAELTVELDSGAHTFPFGWSFPGYYEAHSRSEVERKLLSVFERPFDGADSTLTKAEYSYIVLKSQLPFILHRLRDRPGGSARAALIQTLCEQKLCFLNVVAKAFVLFSLQQLDQSSDKDIIEAAVFRIFSSTKGHEFSELKTLIDSKGNYHGLHKLLESDFKYAGIRTKARLKHHFVQEASWVVEMQRQRQRIRRRERGEGERESSSENSRMSRFSRVSRTSFEPSASIPRTQKDVTDLSDVGEVGVSPPSTVNREKKCPPSPFALMKTNSMPEINVVRLNRGAPPKDKEKEKDSSPSGRTPLSASSPDNPDPARPFLGAESVLEQEEKEREKEKESGMAHLVMAPPSGRHLRQHNASYVHGYTKIISDVDDTLKCSGGVHPAGVDRRLPRKSIYPGVLAFYRELDLGPENLGPWDFDANNIGNLVFLSARPHVYKDLTEAQTYKTMQKLVAEKRMHCVPTLLAGTMRGGGAYMLTDNLEPMARDKVQNFAQYAQLYPEFSYVFVGDNGQGDFRAASILMTEKEHLLHSPKMAFIHVVIPTEQTFGLSQADPKIADRICFFSNYVEASSEAYRKNLISLVGLFRICKEAKEEMEGLAKKMDIRALKGVNEDLDASLQRALLLIEEELLGFKSYPSYLPPMPELRAHLTMAKAEESGESLENKEGEHGVGKGALEEVEAKKEPEASQEVEVNNEESLKASNLEIQIQ